MWMLYQALMLVHVAAVIAFLFAHGTFQPWQC